MLNKSIALVFILAGTLMMASEKPKSGRNYHSLDLVTYATKGSPYPYGCTQGIVNLVKREDDGDDHIRVTKGDKFIVAEAIPEMRFDLPKKGDEVTVCGVLRYDGEHKWWEVHPILEPMVFGN